MLVTTEQAIYGRGYHDGVNTSQWGHLIGGVLIGALLVGIGYLVWSSQKKDKAEEVVGSQLTTNTVRSPEPQYLY